MEKRGQSRRNESGDLRRGDNTEGEINTRVVSDKEEARSIEQYKEPRLGKLRKNKVRRIA